MRAPRIRVLLVAAVAATATVDACAIIIPLARGQDATFNVTVSNTTSVDVPIATFEGLAPLPWVEAEYVVTTLNPNVCMVGYGNLNGSLLKSFEISATSVAANRSVTCLIDVHRNASSYYAFGAGFSPANYLSPGIVLSDTNWIVGPIADLSIQSQQISPYASPGGRVGYVEITVGNKGPWDVQNADFGYCQDVAIAPFTLSNDVPDGCGIAQSGPVCFGTGGPSVQFGIGALAAHQTKSCVLRVTANAPLTTPIGFPLFLVGEPQSLTGEYPVDPNWNDNMTDLAVAPANIGPVPLGSVLAVILSGLLVLSAWLSRATYLNSLRARADALNALNSTAAAFSLATLALFSQAAHAGDMDAVGWAILSVYVYAGIVIALSILALVACKWIANPWWRAIIRLLIVVVVYTPVPRPEQGVETISAVPAFFLIFADPGNWPHVGWLSHPFLLSYAGAMLLGVPVAMLWTYVSQIYSAGRLREASQAQRSSVTSSTIANTPPT